MNIENSRVGKLFIVTAVTALFMFIGATSAFADDCANLGGNIVGTECRITGAAPGVAPNNRSGTFTLAETLRITSTGIITVTSPSLTINITGAGNGLIMEAGSLIDGGDRNCGGPNQTAFPITINTDGDIDVQGPDGSTPGAIIRANGCSGAAIVLNAGGIANIDGTVESVGARTGTGATQGPGGGPISVKANCDLTVSDTGLVSSRGLDPGADLVHLEACTVTVDGKVESTGPGHAVPNSPANHCDNNAGQGGGLRPDKPSNSTACVEIWADRITIDSTGATATGPGHHGEVNADIGQAGDATGRSWIDIYARTRVTIIDGAGNNHKTPVGGVTGGVDTTFAVHANQFKSNGANSTAGLITIKSMEGDAQGSGDVAQADDTAGLAKGGTVTLHAFNNVNLNGGTNFARGDFAESGGYGVGGKIFVRSFHGSLSWGNGVVDARPIGTDTVGTTLPAANRGVITLQDCLAPAGVDTSTLVVPSNNNPASGSVAGFSVVADNCTGTITKPDYVILPPATCSLSCQLPATKRGIKYNDLNNNGVRDGSPLEPVLPNWQIHLFGQPKVNGLPVGPPIDLSRFTDGNGQYEFVVPAGSYTVCETQQPSWTQRQPGSGPDCTGHGGGTGYTVELAPGQLEDHNDFGNHQEADTLVCPEDPRAILTRTVDLSGGHAGLPNYTSLQAAYDAAANGEVIGIFGKFTENVILGDHDGIEGDKSLKITQCTSAQFTARDNSKPVFSITSTGNLTIVSPDSVGGSVGWLVATDGHHLKSIRANNAVGEGVLVLGSNNEISWNDIGGNAIGMRVEGSSNDLKGGTVDNNTFDGVVFGVLATKNSLQGATIQLNGGNGVRVDGTLNTIKSNSRLTQNTLSGLYVTGASNQILSNQADSNSRTGFQITGFDNFLQDNKASKNTGFGFDISGGTLSQPNRLKSNTSNNGSSGGSSENGAAEFQLFNYVKSDSGGNKADGVSIPKTSAPTKCSQFPANNITKLFSSIYQCGDGVD